MTVVFQGEVKCPLCGVAMQGEVMEHMRKHGVKDAIKFAYPCFGEDAAFDVSLVCCCRFETKFNSLTDAWGEMYQHWSECGDLHATILMMRPEQ